MKYGDKTRFKDKDGNYIYIGDVVLVEEYPDRYVGGSLAYEGVIEWNHDFKAVVATYYDIGEKKSTMLSHFPVHGRKLLNEEQRKTYWKSAMLGAEPPERLWKRKRYFEQNAIHEAMDKEGVATNYADYAFVN